MDIDWTGLGPVNISIEWTQPNINDFDYFNVYVANSGGSWELLDNTIGSQYNFTKTNTDYAEYYVTTVDQAGQESNPSAFVVYDFTIGINNNMVNVFGSVYPNPSDGQVNISLNIKQSGYYNLAVYGIDGRVISSVFQGNLNTGKTTVQWNGKNESGQIVPNGIYFISLVGNQIHQQQKVVMIR
jgi:hypothetical protein